MRRLGERRQRAYEARLGTAPLPPAQRERIRFWQYVGLGLVLPHFVTFLLRQSAGGSALGASMPPMVTLKEREHAIDPALWTVLHAFEYLTPVWWLLLVGVCVWVIVLMGRVQRTGVASNGSSLTDAN